MPVTTNDLASAIADFTKRPAPTITETDTLASLHLDSLALLEIIGSVEDKFAIQVDEDDLVDLKNVGDLLRVLNKAPKRK
jgi:acyl carrier protein